MRETPVPKRKTAVAFQYDAAVDGAPRVTAKGHGLVAEKSMALARAQGIPLREDADLVQALAQLDLHQEIPPSTSWWQSSWPLSIAAMRRMQPEVSAKTGVPFPLTPRAKATRIGNREGTLRTPEPLEVDDE